VRLLTLAVAGAKVRAKPAARWGPDDTKQCVGTTLSPPVRKESLGVGVLLHPEDVADQITLYRAMARSRCDPGRVRAGLGRLRRLRERRRPLACRDA
jgi:hypothetical protein